MGKEKTMELIGLLFIFLLLYVGIKVLAVTLKVGALLLVLPIFLVVGLSLVLTVSLVGATLIPLFLGLLLPLLPIVLILVGIVFLLKATT
jgi:hypothetical protein